MMMSERSVAAAGPVTGAGADGGDGAAASPTAPASAPAAPETPAVVPCCVVRTQDQREHKRESLALTAAAIEDDERIVFLELRHVALDKLPPLDKSLERLFVAGRGSLGTIEWSDCVLSDRVMTVTAERLAQNQIPLETLVLRRCRQLSMTSLIAVSTLLTPTLVTLELTSCRLARQAGIILGQSLVACRGLRRLLLGDNHLRDGGIRAIFDAIRGVKSSSMLELVDLSRNGLTVAGLASMASLPIVHLNLAHNGLTSTGPLLLASHELASLDLTGNPLSDAAFHELITQVFRPETQERLRELRLEDCGVSKVGEGFLLSTIQQQSPSTIKLERLFLGEILTFDDNDGCDDEADEPAFRRFTDIQDLARAKCPGLTIHVRSPMPLASQPHLADDSPDPMRAPASMSSMETIDECEPTPGRLVRRELLERKEFLRRHSEELLVLDENASTFGSEKLLDAPSHDEQSHHGSDIGRRSPRNATKIEAKSERPSSSSSNRSQVLHGLAEDDASSPPRRPSTMPSTFATTTHPSSQLAVFPLNPSLDDVASQFSIDQPSISASALQHLDVEYIVSRTIDTMNRNFEQRMAQFLLRMEYQQQEKNTTQLQSLAAKVEACERAIPRMEARLDVLADRIATSGAQVAKMQNDVQSQLQQLRQESLVRLQTPPTPPQPSPAPPISTTTPLTTVMRTQVDEVVLGRLRVSEQQLLQEVAKLRRETVTPQTVIDAVSGHLMQFKTEFEANQTTVLRRFTENIVKDGLRVEDRMDKMDAKIAHLESIIQAEQQASLLALEAISEAFTAPEAAAMAPGPGAVAPIGVMTPVTPLTATAMANGATAAVHPQHHHQSPAQQTLHLRSGYSSIHGPRR